jgi:predicted CXXCH cytochrome family protein
MVGACLSCHDTHAPATADNPLMLRLPAGDAETCVACHEEQGGVVGTDHDLRLVADRLDPELGDRLDEAGTCAACHDVHYGRDREGWDGIITDADDE